MAIEKGKRFLSGTIDQYLLNIAEGLRQAQEELSQMQVTRPGEGTFTYHIPSVEFELKLTFELEQDSSPETSAINPLALTGVLPESLKKFRRIPTIKARPVNPNTAPSGSFEAGASSTLKGRFVSVPANGGAPLPVLEVTAEPGDSGKEVTIIAEVSNAAGEALAGTNVEFNIDREFSELLNREAVQSGIITEKQGKLQPPPRLESAVVQTDDQGVAAVKLSIPEPGPGVNIALMVFAEGKEISLIHEISH